METSDVDHFSNDVRPSSTGPGPTPSPIPRPSGRRLLRLALNLWLVFHISAIIIAPASVSPSSELVASGWRLFRPYLQFLYLNHGHHFFAPEPAESTLLAYVAVSRRRDERPRTDPQLRHQASAALSPPFHADRAHGPGARGTPQAMVPLVRRCISAGSTARPGSA